MGGWRGHEIVVAAAVEGVGLEMFDQVEGPSDLKNHCSTH